MLFRSAICFHPFGRRHNEAFWGVLTRLEVDGPGGTPARVMTYQLAHAAAPGYSAEEAREARESGLGDLHATLNPTLPSKTS